MATTNPRSGTRGWVTDGGLETDLIYHRGADLPEFAAFPLVGSEQGRAVLEDYYAGYAAIAAEHGLPLLLETPTWRANPDWAALLGYDAAALDRANRAAVELLAGLAERWSDRLVETKVVGAMGPRGDGYVPGHAMTPAEAADYHRPQVASLAAAGADRVSALTLTDVGEAAGIAIAARDVGVGVAVSFTVETDGRLPGGESLHEAVSAVDAVCPPDYFLVNCAHPDHIAAGLGEDPVHAPGEEWRLRVRGLRVNASRASHAELDASTELDDGDPTELARDQRRLLEALPAVDILGGCCGTDARHVAATWALLDGGSGLPPA